MAILGGVDSDGAGCIDTAKQGTLHDMKFDLQGRHVASASADGFVRVWSASERELQAELRGHSKPAISLGWASTVRAGRNATLLASGASDGHVVVWRNDAGDSAVGVGAWPMVHQFNVTGAAAEVAFSPPLEGAGQAILLLAVAGTDDLGVVTIIARRETGPGSQQSAGEQWQQVSAFPAHPGGVTALSWMPSSSPVTLATGPAVARANAVVQRRRLATSGADGVVRIWRSELKTPAAWTQEEELLDNGASGAVQDVAWRPNMGIPASLVASCTDDGSVAIWVQDSEGQPWRLQTSWRVNGAARRLAWTRSGMILAVSVGDDGTYMYQERENGQWAEAANLSDEAN
eukprot:TRINITY_DN68881_c0_g1_i1.p1 TRINITY_DN68881_c0_g1~~TRINITY_DN68881_c0_g1_i1.p1  ORF type:complete len:346 (-),score=58.75 TRINITY_DN68881_c0_g1_i1:99-1136(-)